jgi:hypothetical protein
MLKFSMPLYEVKFEKEDVWQEISELEMMDELYKTYKKVTPAIKEMIMGKEVKTPHGSYRLKLKGDDNGGEQVELSAA